MSSLDYYKELLGGACPDWVAEQLAEENDTTTRLFSMSAKRIAELEDELGRVRLHHELIAIHSTARQQHHEQCKRIYDTAVAAGIVPAMGADSMPTFDDLVNKVVEAINTLSQRK